jgi:hypothetical protein
MVSCRFCNSMTRRVGSRGHRTARIGRCADPRLRYFVTEEPVPTKHSAAVRLITTPEAFFGVVWSPSRDCSPRFEESGSAGAEEPPGRRAAAVHDGDPGTSGRGRAVVLRPVFSRPAASVGEYPGGVLRRPLEGIAT